MSYKIVVSMALMIFLSISSLAWAKHGHDDMMMDGRLKGKGNGPMWFLKMLDLTKEQQEQVDKIIDQHQSERQALHEKIDAARKTLQDAVHTDTFDELKIRSASQTLAANMEEIAVLKGKIVSEIRPILTPEQLENMKEMRNRHQERMKCREKCREMAAE